LGLSGDGHASSPFLNDIVQHFHHGYRLLLRKSFLLQLLDEAEGVKMVISLARRRSVEGPSEQ
jgi:hypothetical protein